MRFLVDDDNSYSVVTPAEGRPMRATTMDFYLHGKPLNRG